MDKKTEKADIVPVKKEKAAERTHANLLTPFEEMEHWAEEFFPRSWFPLHRREWPFGGRLATAFEGRTPKVDVIDRDDEVFIKAELPGVDKKDIEVSLSDNMITIKASTSKEEKEEKGDYHRCEISKGSFSRSMSLPANVNIDKSEAKFKDGILELRLPKVEAAKRRNIKVE